MKNKKYTHVSKGNIWGADIADIPLISKLDKGFRFLLCAINVYSKYARVVHLKDKKGITITKCFQDILNESGRKPNKICVDKASDFYNTSMKSWLQDNDMEMYSTHNEGKHLLERQGTKYINI